MKIFYVYLHCKPDGTPFYVGKGCDQKTSRRSHTFSNRKNPRYLRTIEKYGRENIGIFVFPCQSEEQAFSDEILWIAKLREDGIDLANITDGGEGISMPKSQAWKDKMSASLKGRKSPMKGRSHSPETKEKMRLAMLGKKTRLGSKMTDEQRERMSAAQMGNTNNLGHKSSLEKKMKISESQKGHNRPWSAARRAAYERSIAP